MGLSSPFVTLKLKPRVDALKILGDLSFDFASFGAMVTCFVWLGMGLFFGELSKTNVADFVIVVTLGLNTLVALFPRLFLMFRALLGNC